MARSDHFAVLVTIDRYPGLSDLHGPERDGHAFRAWLESASGGDVDPSNIAHIKSSTFGVMSDAYVANPTERQLVYQLDRWMRVSGGWQNKVGERLYMYFAGHGFTAGSTISDPALFSAIAQSGDPAHIAGYRYASKIANAGFFDEIVLVMDCCQDVLKASQVLEPTWSPPDRNQSANVRLLQAYSAPRGRKAFERVLTEGAAPQGLFSTVWLEALETAVPDEEGWVTGHAVKTRVQQLWKDRFKQETGYDPPVRTPDGEDIRLFRRPPKSPASAAPALGPKEPVGKVEAPSFPMPTETGQAGDAGGIGAPGDVPAFSGIGAGSGVDAAGGSFFDIDGPSTPEFPLEATQVPTPVNVELSASDRGTEIIVFDATLKKLESGFGQMTTTLLPGMYTAQFKTADASSEQLFRVDDRSLTLSSPPLEFASAAPVIDTTRTHEYQRIPAEAFATAPVHRVLGASEAHVLIFVRDSQHSPGIRMQSPTPWQYLRLESLQSDTAAPLFDPSDALWGTQSADGFGACKLGVREGAYALVWEEGAEPWTDKIRRFRFAIQAVRGWRTEVYVDCLPQTEDENGPPSSRLDLSSASVHLVRMDADSLLSQGLGRETEIARLRLATGRRVAPLWNSEGNESPMLALFAAYSALGNGDDAPRDVRRLLDDVPQDLLTDLPDFVLLDRWCRSKEGDPLAQCQPLLGVPMLSRGWQLSVSLPAQAGLHDGFGVAVGQWRVGGSLWTCWNQPLEKAEELLEMLRRDWALEIRDRARSVATGGSGQPRSPSPALQRRSASLRPPWNVESWAPVVKGLRDPDSMQSPFQQALRRRILDGVEDRKLGINPFAIGAQFGLPPAEVAQAYEELFRAAQEGAQPPAALHAAA